MQYQVILILLVQFLFLISKHVRSTPVLDQSFFSIEYLNITDDLAPMFLPPACTSNEDCHMHGVCEDSKCKCDKGWLTCCRRGQCSYKQSSKLLAFILSFVVGCAGIDWFFLSHKDSLYILCGILKLLISTGCCIWSPLAVTSKNKSAMTAASCLSVSLTLITFIWWFVDWIRILFNKFPDGNGAALV